MAKNIAWIFVSLLLAVLTFFGVQRYDTMQNTPERMVETFVGYLEAGQIEPAYARLTAKLKQSRGGFWKEVFSQLKGQTSTFVSRESVDDALNTYPQGSNPERFVYTFRRADKQEMSLTIVVYNIQNVWVIDELLLQPT